VLKYNGPTPVEFISYHYDAFDRRIARFVDSTPTSAGDPWSDARAERFVYDGDDVLLDFLDADGYGDTGNDTIQSKRYLHGAVDQVMAEEDLQQDINAAGRVLWHLGDNVWTVRNVVNNAGAITHFTFDSFGKLTSAGTPATRYLFAGRERDPSTGLQYNRHRWYDPGPGRFINEDPIGFGGGDANLYRYAGNSPTNEVDPLGLTGTGTEGDPPKKDPPKTDPPKTDPPKTDPPKTDPPPPPPPATSDVYTYAGPILQKCIDHAIWGPLATWGYDSDDALMMLSSPLSTVGGSLQGAGHGAAMMGNAATFHKIDSLNLHVSTTFDQAALVDPDFGTAMYNTANVSGHVGVYAAAAAAGAWGWGVAGLPTWSAGIGTSPAGGSTVIFGVGGGWGASMGSATTWYYVPIANSWIMPAPSMVTAGACTFTGVPILFPGAAVGAPSAWYCWTAAARAFCRGYGGP